MKIRIAYACFKQNKEKYRFFSFKNTVFDKIIKHLTEVEEQSHMNDIIDTELLIFLYKTTILSLKRFIFH